MKKGKLMCTLIFCDVDPMEEEMALAVAKDLNGSDWTLTHNCVKMCKTLSSALQLLFEANIK